MKNIINILVLTVICFSFTMEANAQKTYPRFGTTSRSNQTFSGVTLGLHYLADTAGVTTDTVTFSPNEFCGNYILTLTDSCVLAFKSVGNSYLGDNFTVTIFNSAGSGHFVDFLGYSSLSTRWGMTSTGTKISLTTGSTATLKFYFDGAIWNEISRAVR